MAIDEIQIDCDEDGFHLILTGDFEEACRRYLASDAASLKLRLPQDAALELAGQVRNTLAPWAADYDEALATYQRTTPAERRAMLDRLRDPDDCDDDAEALREAADLARKAERENA